jgi:hypothetical protein
MHVDADADADVDADMYFEVHGHRRGHRSGCRQSAAHSDDSTHLKNLLRPRARQREYLTEFGHCPLPHAHTYTLHMFMVLFV